MVLENLTEPMRGLQFKEEYRPSLWMFQRATAGFTSDSYQDNDDKQPGAMSRIDLLNEQRDGMAKWAFELTRDQMEVAPDGLTMLWSIADTAAELALTVKQNASRSKSCAECGWTSPDGNNRLRKCRNEMLPDCRGLMEWDKPAEAVSNVRAGLRACVSSSNLFPDTIATTDEPTEVATNLSIYMYNQPSHVCVCDGVSFAGKFQFPVVSPRRPPPKTSVALLLAEDDISVRKFLPASVVDDIAAGDESGEGGLGVGDFRPMPTTITFPSLACDPGTGANVGPILQDLMKRAGLPCVAPDDDDDDVDIQEVVQRLVRQWFLTGEAEMYLHTFFH